MLFKFIVTISFLFPMVGVWLMENGAFGGSVGKVGGPNGATWAFLLYCGVAFFTMWAASKLRLFYNVGKGKQEALRHPAAINIRSMLFMGSMLLFFLFGLRGLENYYGLTTAGEFRASLGAAGGLFGSIMLKYLAPSIVAFALMTNVAWNPRRVQSMMVLLLCLIMVLIGGSTGYKSSFVLAILPAAILYCWRLSPWALLPLGFVAVSLILFGYIWFAGSPTFADAIEKMGDRLFVLQGDVAWLVWDLHVHREPIPPYSATLLPIAGDRIFSMMTGITREKELEWVMAHFGLMITHLSGYSIEAILGGHNNTATPFSEGIIAGGLLGAVMFAILAGLMINMLYNFIDNRLRANDFAWAAIAASYFVNGVMAWLISGGLPIMIHISIPILLSGTYLILRVVRGRRFETQKTATNVAAV